MQYSSGILKKPTSLKSEDIVGFNNDYFWILDGATPPASKKNREATQLYIKLLNASLSYFSLENVCPAELLKKSIRNVKRTYEKTYPLDNSDYLPYSTAIIIKLSDALEYLVLGDSFLSVCTGDQTIEICDDRLKRVAVTERQEVRRLREKGIDESTDIYINARRKLIEAEMQLQNKENGYWVAGFNESAADNSITGKIILNEGQKTFSITAMTDGLARLVTHLGAYQNINEIGKDIVEHGANNIFEKLRTLESNKTNFIKPISSQHDDASFFIISNS
ncbi:hypothetical protein [Neobacillus vireti]|uniref:hypothetical protein n=1 Tax=Neobacillus vireti TaxID=220686 RepID=UPI002FFD6122